MTPEEEALRSVREAETTGAVELDLSEPALNRLPRELASLTLLQSLNLSWCEYLSDVSPLAGLTSLQSLDLFWCDRLSDVSPLAGFISLQWLDLSGCEQLRDLSPLAGLTSLQTLGLDRCLGVRRFALLESLLPTLKKLRLFGCKLHDLPPEVCGETHDENVLDKVRAHYVDLRSGQRLDAEIKVLFLGALFNRKGFGFSR